MRLIDLVFRQGHLSERALLEALASGERPAHLDRCDLCAERALHLGRWLDEVQGDGADAADAVFSAERLAAQQGQILRKLEQLDTPSRVIAFPAAPRAERTPASERRVSVSWVGVAAAAGLVIGVVGGQVSARLMQPAPAGISINALVQPDAQVGPVDGRLLEQSYDQLHIASYEVLDDLTPKLTQVSARQAR